MRRTHSRTILFVGTMLGTAAFAAGAVNAQTQSSSAPASGQGNATTVQEIVVTGSSIKRVDREAPSPVEVISNVEMQHSGYDSISQILSNVTANGQGTLSANNSEAFAGGAAGIALRGLTVGDTLTLIDGHRMASYPLSDDGERPFVDVQSIPFDAIDHVEVLKDGASAVYGSDAIAGVVNIILKKNMEGFTASAEGGTSQHGGGSRQHYTAMLGKGNLDTDGYNAYLSLEYRQQDPIYLNQRTYQAWDNLDFTKYGGINLNPGAPNVNNNGLPNTLTPYLVNNADTSQIQFLGSGCNPAKMAAAQCSYVSPQTIESPTRNINVLGSFTKRFDANWQLNVKASMFDSKGQQDFFDYNTYPVGGNYAGNISNPLGGAPVAGVGATSFILPTGYMGNTFGGPSFLQGVIPQVGNPTNIFDTQSLRLVADLDGQIAGWDVSASMGLTYVITHASFLNNVNYDNLAADLLSGAWNPVGGNSAAEVKRIAPEFGYNATNSLNFAELHASRKLLDWSFGDLAVATGAEIVTKDLNNPGPAPILNGTYPGFSAFAIGKQTDTSVYGEFDSHLFRQIELTGALRYDYYDTYGNSVTPKFGIKWRPSPKFALRATYSEGYRAPSAAEATLSGVVFGLSTTFPDPILCGSTNGLAAGQIVADCKYSPPFRQQQGSGLKPETSKSETAGFVVEPIKGWSSTFDYYHIAIKDQIDTSSELASYSFFNADGSLNTNNCGRGPANPTLISNGMGGTTVGTPLAGPIYCFAGYINANETATSGFDFQTQYKFNFLWDSKITASLSETHVLDYTLTNQGVTYQLAGTHGPTGISGDTGNPRDRINATIAFDRGPLNVTTTVNWISSFSVTDPSSGFATCQDALLNSTQDFTGAASAPSKFCRVSDFTTVNLAASYKVGQHIVLHASIDNLFDADAPLDFQTYGGSFLPFNPAMHEEGVIGRYFTVGVRYTY